MLLVFNLKFEICNLQCVSSSNLKSEICNLKF